MKTLIALTLVLMSSSAFAWTSKEGATKEYVFKFKLQGESYEYKTQKASYEEAYELAAQKCFDHFKGARKVSENRGLDIIDVCANPRS